MDSTEPRYQSSAAVRILLVKMTLMIKVSERKRETTVLFIEHARAMQFPTDLRVETKRTGADRQIYRNVSFVRTTMMWNGNH